MVDDSERTPSFEDHAKMSAALTAQTAIKEVLSNFSQHVQFIRFNAETSVSCKIFSCHYVCCCIMVITWTKAKLIIWQSFSRLKNI